MAEVITELQEYILPEYEQLKKFEICSDEQIRECIRKRQSFHTKITQSEKSIRDYADFIIFEKKMHKWITEKERSLSHGASLSGLKTSVATRIIRLYREGLRQFPHEERFWNNYIQFSKKSVPHEVSGIYEKMLTFHGDKPSVWCDAALWAYEYSMNMGKVKEIFFRGLQRHPESQAINRTFFEILLMEASKMSTERNLSRNISEQSIGLERVEVVYRNSKKKISDISYYLGLLERCEEEKFKNITAPLQKHILDDLMEIFPREEVLWDALAQRELRGFNMSDLRNISKTPNANNGEAELNTSLSSSTVEPDENISTNSGEQESQADIKDPSIKGIWQRRTLNRRIELCCNVYQTGVRTLETPKMWTLYINAMLKLNQDMSTQQELKRKRLAIAFKEGHQSGLMSIEHYCTFLRMLLESPNSVQIVESVLTEAIKIHKSLKLYEVWLSMYIVNNNEAKVLEIFRKANEELGTQTFPLWRLTLQFYKTRYDDCGKRLQKLYREACQQMDPRFGVFRGEYLEFCILNMSMQKTRAEYDDLCQLPPPCLDLHQKMALLESRVAVKSKADLDRWRLCHENATHYFGKTNTSVWIDYIKFERDHGDAKLMSLLYQRAKDTLEDRLVDNFISEYTLLNSII